VRDRFRGLAGARGCRNILFESVPYPALRDLDEGCPACSSTNCVGDVPREIAWENVSTDDLAANARYWELSPGARWHGFTHVAPGYAITDPNKLTLLTPGFDRSTGKYGDYGIPTPVVAQYLRENRVVPEKNDLNSLLFLLSPAVESSKAGTLLSTSVAFKKLHDDAARR
jgi:ornithine decarboxylase